MTKVLKDYLIVILVAASVALTVRLFGVEAFRVPSDFMAPALLPGELIFVNKLAFGFRFPSSGLATSKLSTPPRGSIVIFSLFSDLSKDYIKRVIAVPGDTIEIKDSVVVLNGNTVSIPVKQGEGLTFTEELDGHKFTVSWDVKEQMPAVKIPDGHVFVLGDNRGKGQDSRHWGFLPIAGIKGEAWLIWFSSDRSRIWERIH